MIILSHELVKVRTERISDKTFKPLKNFNTFHIEAHAEKLICIEDVASLLETVTFAKKEKIPLFFYRQH